MIMFEGVDRRCYDHTHCMSGMMCTAGGHVKKGGDYQAEATRGRNGLGQCSDCYYATHEDRDYAVGAFETFIFKFDRTTKAWANPHEIMRKSNNTVTHFVDYCELTDESHKKCDYIHDNVQLMSGKAMLVLLFVAVNLVNAILKDMDQGQNMQKLIKFRLAKPTNSHEESDKLFGLAHISSHRVVNVMRNASLKLRKYLLPTFIVGATCSILVQSELTCSVILMNGLAIGFATELDDMIMVLLVHDRAVRSIDVAFDEVVKAGPDEYDKHSGDGEGWLVRRMYACVLTFEIVYVVLRLEIVLEAFSWAPEGHRYLCEWVSLGIFDFNLVVGVISSVIGTAVSHGFAYLRTKHKQWALWVSDIVLTPLCCVVAAEWVMAMSKYVLDKPW